MAAKAKKLAGKKAKKENKGMMKVELHRNVILGLKEKMFTTLMDGGNNAPSEFVIALSNASTHGNIFEHNGYSLPNDDDALEVWHNCLDVMLLCARIIEGETIGNCTDEQLDEMKKRLKKYKGLFDLAK